MRDIGKNIRDLRESKGLTQEELAARLFVTRQTVSNYETGKTRPDVDMILRMAEVLDADANTVFYGRPIDGDRRRRIITAVSLIAVTAVLWLLELYLRRELTEYKQSTFIIWPLATEELIFKTTVRIMFGYSIVNAALLAFEGKPLVTRWTHIVKIAAIVLTAAAYIGSLLAVLACVIDIHENYFMDICENLLLSKYILPMGLRRSRCGSGRSFTQKAGKCRTGEGLVQTELAAQRAPARIYAPKLFLPVLF